MVFRVNRLKAAKKAVKFGAGLIGAFILTGAIVAFWVWFGEFVADDKMAKFITICGVAMSMIVGLMTAMVILTPDVFEPYDD